jgi:hypothetical protein
MNSIELPLVSGGKVLICMANNITVHKNKDGEVRVLDGLHNNGGWTVKMTYDQVVSKINESLFPDTRNTKHPDYKAIADSYDSSNL